ncbi:hypothetical protein J2Y63_003335 [Shinella sp. BE166]|uniref:hypothetical protein n=1 Tax=Shinella TaxID=323620 RepID=UPI00210BDBC9|nr:hypothetical protein [Shinella lacus]
MALALEHRPVRRASGAHHAGSLSYTLRHIAERIVSAWERHRAERELESMPYDLRKDIGFRSKNTR